MLQDHTIQEYLKYSQSTLTTLKKIYLDILSNQATSNKELIDNIDSNIASTIQLCGQILIHYYKYQENSLNDTNSKNDETDKLENDKLENDNIENDKFSKDSLNNINPVNDKDDKLEKNQLEIYKPHAEGYKSYKYQSEIYKPYADRLEGYYAERYKSYAERYKSYNYQSERYKPYADRLEKDKPKNYYLDRSSLRPRAWRVPVKYDPFTSPIVIDGKKFATFANNIFDYHGKKLCKDGYLYEYDRNRNLKIYEVNKFPVKYELYYH